MSEAPTPDTPAVMVPATVMTATGETCANCGAAMHGAYCYACGQPRKGTIRPLSGIVADFLDTVFNLDARTWRTLAPLYFKPGLLSNEYFAGRRVRYVTPLRLYFFLSIIAFLVISASANVDDIKVNDGRGVRRTAAEVREDRTEGLERGLRFMPKEARDEIRAEVERELAAEAARDAKRAADAAGIASGPPAAPARPAPPADSVGARPAGATAGAEAGRDDERRWIQFNGERWHRTDNPLTFGWLSDDLNAALNDEIGVLLNKIEALEQDPRPFFKELFSIAPQALFFILPLFALLLKLVYVFKRRLYMEHMIVALHSHSFLCLSLLVIAALGWLEEKLAGVAFAGFVVGLVLAAASIWIPLYLLLMQRRVYRQNWFMTLLKFVVVGICYTFLLVFGLLVAMLVSLIFL
ncbi:MAG TPA: DUF3667 domain-containing protein [Candidatus Saccharimonadia bacterium]|nr:DUF3667 domain-containing protein [Candidatus Saccharimonadia bacterium]